MKIERLKDNEKDKYEELVKNYGTIFNSLSWLSIFGNFVEVYGIYDKGDNLIGGFCLFKTKIFFLSIFRNPPFSPTIGPFIKITAKNPTAIMDAWKKVLTSMAEFIEELPYSIIYFSLHKEIVDTQPFFWSKFKVVPCYTYLIDLTRSIDDIQMDMSSERRNDISKGLRDGLVVERLKDYSVVKTLVEKTFSRQEKEIDSLYLKKVLFEYANDKNSFAFATYREGKPIAVAFCVYDKNTAYYLLSGYDHLERHHGAGALAVWESIQHAHDMGLKIFDFEGSMVPQIEKYFRGFGGTMKPYYRINKAKLLFEILLKFYKREFF